MTAEETKKIIGEKIAARVKELGMTRAEFARRAQVSASNINRIVEGRQNYTVETLVRIENTLGIRIFQIHQI